ncbi:juvenile hormone esterase-like [Tribolium madens]|uniref:juvenile hormone esterase-like n=1 Tax=Tribolium madens TaxID=41895 RepID=UPI001CF72848|nr:juvenile hormone esterase-like [Tribolium madens]
MKRVFFSYQFLATVTSSLAVLSSGIHEAWTSVYIPVLLNVPVIIIFLTFGLNAWSAFIMSEPIVTIEQGQLRGKISTNIDNKNFCSFQGIPYAKPPTGQLRFKDPQAPEPWTGIKDATTEGNACYAKHMLFYNVIGSEDCLYLNVYTPEVSSKHLKPVMVWIHGGAFKSGSSNTDIYGPEYLLTQDVVVVTFNYRLGIFGFLKLEDTTLDVSGNAGMKDMVMALKWVQKNISKFSGDPNNVTIFGESAGAASVHYLVLSPLAKGLFHRAIAQSGTALNTFARGRSDIVSHLSTELNTKNEKEILQKLVQMPAEKLFELYEKLVTICEGLNNGGGKLPFAPVIEKASQNAFIAEEPLKIIKSGNYNQVPLIFGFTTREGMLIEQMIKPRKPTMPRDFEAAIPYTLEDERGSETSKQIAKKIKDFYYGEPNSEDKLDNFYIIHTDNYFLRDIIFAVKHHAATSKFPVYLYQMSVQSSLNIMKRLSNITAPGVAHGDDIGYLFKTKLSPDLSPGSLEEISVRRFVRFWTNFAKNGNPDEPQWKPVKINELNYIDIGENLNARVNPEPERMKFWEELYKNKPLYAI